MEKGAAVEADRCCTKRLAAVQEEASTMVMLLCVWLRLQPAAVLLSMLMLPQRLLALYSCCMYAACMPHAS
jgi:hypothetical protein